ncbi:MAG: ATP-binding protein [Candidatus Wallbacteria bacterium]|nr:ATP-binding protein [Candidatus Wallbacteria bacterium]
MLREQATVWVLEGDSGEAAEALERAGHRVLAASMLPGRQKPQLLIADMAHLGPAGMLHVRQAVAQQPFLVPVLIHVWEAHLAAEAVGAPGLRLLLDPLSVEQVVAEVDSLAQELSRPAPLLAEERSIVADLPSIPELVQPVVAYVVRECREAGIPEQQTSTPIPLCLTEALVNAVAHGNREVVSRRARMQARLTADRFWCTVADEGEGFDPSRIPLPTDEANLLRDHGRGLFLIRHFMDEVTFNARGNTITMSKRA